MKLASCRVPALFAVALFGLPGCDGDGDGDTAAGDTGHAEHDGGHEGADPDTRVVWTMAPPASGSADSPVEGTFTVDTEGELHVTEMRACMGHGVADCGLGAMETFETAPATAEGDGYRGSIELDAGDWTVVAYAHVGPDPFVSDPVDVTVE